MWWFLLFIFGLAVGSFLNVVALRYDENRFLLSRAVIGGRSRCPHCSTTLRWYELVPLFSFVLQKGKCRTCRGKVSFQYPLVELTTGLVFALVPYTLRSTDTFLLRAHDEPSLYFSFSAVWLLAFVTLLLITLIDLRLRIIPNEATVFLGVLGIAGGTFLMPHFGDVHGSFMGPYALLFGARGNIWLNRLVALLVGALFLGFLVFITRGRGMGMGDVKLAAALGVLFGWPDIAFVLMLAFIVGALVGLLGIAKKKLSLKGAIPFGPFLAAGAAIIFFLGKELLDAYFSLFPIL